MATKTLATKTLTSAKDRKGVSTDETCMVPGCQRKAGSRGACNSCYCYARKLVVSRLTTWDELEQLKLVRPAHKHKSKNPLQSAFEDAMRNRMHGKDIAPKRTPAKPRRR